MFSLKITIQLLTVVAAVIALWGNTSNGRSLTKLGTLLLVIITMGGTLAFYVMYQEHEEKKAQQIELVKAKSAIFSRMLSNTEGVKRALMWQPLDLLAKRSNVFDYEKGMELFLNPSKVQIKDIKSRFHDPLKGYTRLLSSTYEKYKSYLSFNNVDSITDYISSANSLDLPSLALKYDGKVEFSVFLKENGADKNKLEFLLFHLYAMEKSLVDSDAKNDEELYKLLPECKEVKDIQTMLDCI